jgi:hypothetical protein
MLRFIASLCGRGLRLCGRKRHAVPLAEAETELLEPLPPMTALEACAVVLATVERDRRMHPAALINYDDVVARVWRELPPAVRGADTAVNRAEFASAVRAATRFFDDVDLWMNTPD